MSVCTTRVPGALGGQKSVSEYREGELQPAVGYHVNPLTQPALQPPHTDLFVVVRQDLKLTLRTCSERRGQP